MAFLDTVVANYTYDGGVGNNEPAIYVFNSPYHEGDCPIMGGILVEDANYGGYTYGDITNEYIRMYEDSINNTSISIKSPLLEHGESYVIRIYQSYTNA